VPFFLHGGAALGLGRGEELYPLPDFHAQQALLITSDVHSSTADAYRDLSTTLTGDSLTKFALQNKLNSFQRGVWGNVSGDSKPSIINDFEEVVLARYPVLGEVRGRLRRAGATSVAMTGSGSAIFGIFDNPGKLERTRLAWKRPGERAFPVSFVSRARYRATWRRTLDQDRKGNDLWPPQSRHAR
jgi:4-diphosphocytidyl-2-C-methyl-D-erythritol kinase